MVCSRTPAIDPKKFLDLAGGGGAFHPSPFQFKFFSIQIMLLKHPDLASVFRYASQIHAIQKGIFEYGGIDSQE